MLISGVWKEKTRKRSSSAAIQEEENGNLQNTEQKDQEGSTKPELTNGVSSSKNTRKKLNYAIVFPQRLKYLLTVVGPFT